MPPSVPRILLVAFAPFPAPSGVSTRLAQRILALTGAGFILDVITPKTAALPHVSTLATARIFRVPMPGMRDSSPGHRTQPISPASLSDQLGAFERAVRRQLQGNEYDAIHLFDPSATAAVLNHREQARILYEIGNEGLASDDAALAAELQRRHRRLLDSAAALFVPSRLVSRAVENEGAWPARIHLLRPSVDVELFQPAADLSKRGASPCRIAVVATRLHSDELSMLGGAILRLAPSVDVRVIVSAAVDSGDRRQLESDAALRDRFALHTPVLYDDLVPFYAGCDAGIVLSTRARTESVRLQSVAEVMAAGLAPILPDVPTVRELVRGDGDALLFPPGDIEALANAIERVASNARLRRHLGRGARQAAMIQLDERTAREKLVQTYVDCLGTLRRVTEETPRPAPDGQSPHRHIDSILRSSSALDKGGQAAPNATVSQRPPARSAEEEERVGGDDVTVPETNLPLEPRWSGRRP